MTRRLGDTCGRIKDRYQTGIAYFTLGSAITRAGAGIYRWSRNRISWSVAVTSNDWLYPEVHRWLLETVGNDEIRSLLASTVDVGKYYDSSESKTLSFYSDDRRSHSVYLDGYRVEVSMDRPDAVEIKDMDLYRRLERIQFTTFSAGGVDAVKRHLDSLVVTRSSREKKATFHAVASWGEWQEIKDIPLRSLGSVVLRKGQAERIREDFKKFLEDEVLYNERQVPYHRGYLFHGPPGSGKTSLAKALANEFSLDVWYLALGDVKNDTSLMNLVSAISPRSVLLLEDVDVFSVTGERDKNRKPDEKISLSGLLNALDGMMTPHGLITIMTTNHFDNIDPALIRTGRVDLQECIENADADQANRLFEFFYGHAPEERFKMIPADMTTSDLADVFKRHFNDAEGAEAEVHARGLKVVEDAA